MSLKHEFPLFNSTKNRALTDGRGEPGGNSRACDPDPGWRRQAWNPPPPELMCMFIGLLLYRGVGIESILQMIQENPGKILGLDEKAGNDYGGWKMIRPVNEVRFRSFNSKSGILWVRRMMRLLLYCVGSIFWFISKLVEG